MPASVKIPSKVLKWLDKIQSKLLLTDIELAEKLWIWRSTFYKLVKDKSTSHTTLRKIITFLEENWYDVN